MSIFSVLTKIQMIGVSPYISLRIGGIVSFSRRTFVHKHRGELLLLLATVFAAIGWISSKKVLQEMPGSAFICGRFILASLLLLPFCYRKLLNIPTVRVAKTFAVGLVLASSIHVWVYAVSITQGLSEGAFIMSLAMIIAPLTGWLLFRNRPNRAFWLSLPIAILGMGLLTLTNGWQVEKSQWLFLMSSCLLSVHFVLNKRLGGSIDPLTSICLQMFIIGTTGFILFWIQSHDTLSLSLETVFWFAIATLIATTLRYLTQTVGQYSVNIEIAALIMILEPIWTLALSHSILSESLETHKLAGSILILLSLVLYIQLSKAK
jgi:drug/metabolite transporter (DMT)-like permease